MTTKKLLEQLEKDEQEDFISACQKYGFNSFDFQIKMEEQYSVGLGAIWREATVVLLKNGKNKKYDAGHATAWIASFEDDLQIGFYK